MREIRRFFLKGSGNLVARLGFNRIISVTRAVSSGGFWPVRKRPARGSLAKREIYRKDTHMKKHRTFVLALALVVVAGWTVGAFAADTAANPPAKPGKRAPAAKATAAPNAPVEAKPKTEVKCEVSGKLDTKTVTNKRGREVKAFQLAVSQAKDADGKSLDGLKGKTLRVVPNKGVDIAVHVGKEVTVTGTLINNKRLVAESIK